MSLKGCGTDAFGLSLGSSFIGPLRAQSAAEIALGDNGSRYGHYGSGWMRVTVQIDDMRV